MATNIYLMQDEYTEMYKIGRSVDVFKRERTLLSQAPKIRLCCYWEDYPVTAERYWHKRFARHRRRGEWFSLSWFQLTDMQIGFETDPVLCNGWEFPGVPEGEVYF